MKGNPLITCTFCRTQFKRCRPRTKGGGRRVIACKALVGRRSQTAAALTRMEQE